MAVLCTTSTPRRGRALSAMMVSCEANHVAQVVESADGLKPSTIPGGNRDHYSTDTAVLAVAKGPGFGPRELMQATGDRRVMEDVNVWAYEPDEVPKRKHRWGNDYAGFVEVGGNLVGKCPTSMTMDRAEKLLNDGIPWSPGNWRRPYPKRIYVIGDDGVLYRATPTNPGRSYHGFPEHYLLFPDGSQNLRKQLLQVARERGCEDKVREWMRW